MKKISLVLINSLVLLFPASALALVAITNGNYFNGFTDLLHPGDVNLQLKVERTYNSRSQYEGVFGYGWGSEFETYLLVSADGSVVIQESGGGEKTRFTPKKFAKESLSTFVKRIAEARAKKKKGSFNLKSYTAKLMKNADFRDEQGRELKVRPRLKVGTVLYSSARGSKQKVTVLKNGFVREYGDRKKSYFTTQANVKDFGVGRQRVLEAVYKITKFEDGVKKKTINYKYNDLGQLVLMTDGRKQRISFKYDTNGKLIEAKDRLGRKATYAYCPSNGYNSAKKCGRGDLVRTTDAAGNTYKFEYDNVHNMTKIAFADGSVEEVAFWPPTPPGEGGVKRVKARNGVVTEYSYWSDPKDKRLHYKSTVKTTYKSGRSTESSYEYWRKRRSDGSTYKYKLATAVNGEKTETVYNECCGQPLQVKNSSGTTRYEYFAESGLPKLKDTPTETTTWEYSSKYKGKVTKVRVATKGGKSTARESKFSYNSKGNLDKATTSDGRGVALQYDRNGRILAMIDHEKRKIIFEYNTLSKPVKITQKGTGSISVTYDGKGNISGVKSKGGRSIALSVTAAFQNLLEIIKPAGIRPI